MKEKIKSFNLNLSCTRRDVLKAFFTIFAAASFPISCNRHRYIREAEEIDLGAVKDLLYSRNHLRSTGVLLFRDVDGWAAMSSRCTYMACDLTYQESILLCPCCKSIFGIDGIPYQDSLATVSLPWLELFYKDGHLYVNTDPAKEKPSSWRFTTPEIEEALRELKERVKAESITDGLEIPKVLLSEYDKEIGGMFLEDDPNLISELKMLK